ncbi:hypothetical protein HN51_030962 [Arachis hypogaea]
MHLGANNVAATTMALLLLITTIFSSSQDPRHNQIPLGSTLYPATQPTTWLSPSNLFAFGFYQQQQANDNGGSHVEVGPPSPALERVSISVPLPSSDSASLSSLKSFHSLWCFQALETQSCGLSASPSSLPRDSSSPVLRTASRTSSSHSLDAPC